MTDEKKSVGYLGKALLIELRPIPMALAILSCLFGAVLAFQLVGIRYPLLLIHTANVAVILYSAHLVDTYNDYGKRQEYQRGYKQRKLLDGHNSEQIINLNPKHYLYAMLVTYPIAIILSGILVIETGIIYLILAISGLILSATYGSGLDRILILGDLAWDMGIVLAFMGGFYVVAKILTPEIIVMSIILLPILCGVKIIDAEPDREIDADSQPVKRTTPVVLGLKWSHRLAYILMIAPLILLMFTAPTLHYSLIVPLIIATGVILYSYHYPPEKAMYFIASAIILFLVWAIIVLI